MAQHKSIQHKTQTALQVSPKLPIIKKNGPSQEDSINIIHPLVHLWHMLILYNCNVIDSVIIDLYYQ